MEEKKKRFRPTLAEYREMEDVIHRQCVELDAWREKYDELDKQLKCLRREMEAGHVITLSDYNAMAGRNDILEKRLELLDEVCKEKDGEIATLQQSNRSMESELRRNINRHEGEMKRWKEKALEAETELMRLKARGFFSRLFNL